MKIDRAARAIVDRMTTQIHDLDYQAPGPKRCRCGAPWRFADCTARRQAIAETPFRELSRPMKVAIVVLGGGSTIAAAALLLGLLVKAIAWAWS